MLCILCYLKLKKSDITQKDLIQLCPSCREHNEFMAKFNKADAMADGNNICRAITCTLKPIYHTVDPESIVGMYQKIIKTVIRQCKTPAYFEGVFEVTQQGVLHIHAYACLRKTNYARLMCRLRRLGFCKVTTPQNLAGWVEYMYKEFNYEFPIISISS